MVDFLIDILNEFKVLFESGVWLTGSIILLILGAIMCSWYVHTQVSSDNRGWNTFALMLMCIVFAVGWPIGTFSLALVFIVVGPLLLVFFVPWYLVRYIVKYFDV